MHSTDRRLVIWWIILLGLTFLSFESSWGLAWAGNPSAAIALVIGVALLKVRIVVLHFMEVGEAPWVLRAPLEVWGIALAASILAFWYSVGA